MRREEFTKVVDDMLGYYIDNYMDYDSDPQLRVNPASMAVDIINGKSMHNGIEYSDEVIENAAAAHGLDNQDVTDFQARQNSDFYPVRRLVHAVDGKPAIDVAAVRAIVDVYYR